MAFDLWQAYARWQIDDQPLSAGSDASDLSSGERNRGDIIRET